MKAAASPSTSPCVPPKPRNNWLYELWLRFIDPGGAGYFGKAARNGIECGDMQLMCKVYAMLRISGSGTGHWTPMNAAENALVVSAINAAVEVRVLSSMKAARVAATLGHVRYYEPETCSFTPPSPTADRTRTYLKIA